MPRSISSRLSGQTVVTTTSGLSQMDVEQIEKAKKALVILGQGPLLFTLLGISMSVFIICGIVRSAILLDSSVAKYKVLDKAEDKLTAFRVMEMMAELVYKESFARLKYMSTGLNPIYYNEMTTAIDDMDNLLTVHADEFALVYFHVADYRQYLCSFYRIRSNLESRSNAVPINQHRSLDERTLDPWYDVDYYECLLSQLADIQAQAMTSSEGFDTLWQTVYSYLAAVRSLLHFEIALNYAYLTRELVLKKGSVAFKRTRDSDALETSLAIAQRLLRRAYQIAFYGIGPSSLPAIEIADHLVDQMSAITNATKAYLLVQQGDKFEPTTPAKSVLNYLNAAVYEFKEDMLRLHGIAITDATNAIISECIKLFFFAVILPCMAIRTVLHFKNEAERLKIRYELSVDRYFDSCKAIFRLLPEPVAKKLNVGMQVRPEYFNNATVFYSDIVGFTNICSKLTAIQVLQMLNSIYTTFDCRMKIYNCYKIETIGDAYVVASGVPTRNHTHAAEIASLALVLVEEVGMIKVPNSSKKITVRIGINSGPVIAGIVGVKMLRYCLFGKTVLYAARMEQTSQAQRIQLSHTTYAELVSLGGFIIEDRPKNEWPNNEQPTHWLFGKTTTTPTLSLFAETSKDTGLAHVDISTA